MPHAIWKGHISFGLVSIPIFLYPVENKGAMVSFRQLDKRNNAPIKYQRINSKTGKEVPWENVIKGYEYSKDEILPVGEGELKKVAGENAKTIAIEEFVDKKNLTFTNIDKAYYLVPDKKSEKGYVILREALKAANKIGIAKVIISTKEYLAAVATDDNALVLYTLHYADEIRDIAEFSIPSEKLATYKVSAKEVEIAKKLITAMSKTWKPSQYKDEYREAVSKWVEKKLKKLPSKPMKSRDTAVHGKKNIINFADLLKKSLTSQKSAKNDPRFKAPTTKKNKRKTVSR